MAVEAYRKTGHWMRWSEVCEVSQGRLKKLCGRFENPFGTIVRRRFSTDDTWMAVVNVDSMGKLPTVVSLALMG